MSRQCRVAPMRVHAAPVRRCAAVAGAAPAAAGAREFRAADIQEENYPTVQALRYMDQLVTERTGGRHRIRVFHSRQLGEESQTIEQTRVGAIDINRINVGAIGNYRADRSTCWRCRSCSARSTISTRSSTGRSARRSSARSSRAASSG